MYIWDTVRKLTLYDGYIYSLSLSLESYPTNLPITA